MFRFAEPQYLYLLLLLPALVVGFIFHLHHRRKQLRKFGDPDVIRQLMPEASTKRIQYKFALLVTALGLIIFALAQPQFGSKLREVTREGVEIMVAVDVSRSMLAQDLKPNRLELTKNALTRMVDELKDDRIGVVVFAGEAYIQLPITSDYISAKTFINPLSTDIVPVQGTSISKAIELASNSFSEQSQKSRVIILITDGESHDDDPINAAQMAKENGIVIFTVGIGTLEGAPIIINGKEIKDDQGNAVITKLGEQSLMEIAVLTGGAYVRASNQNIGLSDIFTQIKTMERQKFDSLVFEEYNDQFYYLVIIALILIIIEFLVIDRKSRIFSRISVFREKPN